MAGVASLLFLLPLALLTKAALNPPGFGMQGRIGDQAAGGRPAPDDPMIQHKCGQIFDMYAKRLQPPLKGESPVQPAVSLQPQEEVSMDLAPVCREILQTGLKLTQNAARPQGSNVRGRPNRFKRQRTDADQSDNVDATWGELHMCHLAMDAMASLTDSSCLPGQRRPPMPAAGMPPTCPRPCGPLASLQLKHFMSEPEVLQRCLEILNSITGQGQQAGQTSGRSNQSRSRPANQ